MSSKAAHCPIDLGAETVINLLLQMPATSYPAILDSCHYQDYGLYDGRYLIAAYNPELCLQATGDEIYQYSRSGESITRGDVTAHLDKLLAERYCVSDTGLPCAAGAAIGLFSYELAHRFERLPVTPITSHSVPDLFLSFYPVVIVHDYQTADTMLIACADNEARAQARLAAARAQLERAAARVPAISAEIVSRGLNYRSNFTPESYERAVEKIKGYIAAGDIYQANLTQQFQIDLGALSPATIFLRLRKHFPVPFAAFMKTPEWTVVSGSPERFLHRRGARVAAYPIKGTRPRGRAPAEDEQLAEQLKTSEKDIAENIMIVDLLRNDLGRVCQIGTVDASQLLTLQALPTVYHLVSKVSGQLRADVTAGRLLAAAFPCGSITGAPKIRAMEIITEVEKVQRGLSMGAVGWLGYNGDLDLNVAIRTLFIREGVGYMNVGGAVVADSDPAAEYQESLLKSQALFRAIGLDRNYASSDQS